MIEAIIQPILLPLFPVTGYYPKHAAGGFSNEAQMAEKTS